MRFSLSVVTAALLATQASAKAVYAHYMVRIPSHKDSENLG